jgi:hypothetical protein
LRDLRGVSLLDGQALLLDCDAPLPMGESGECKRYGEAAAQASS